jgi:tRNA threonylcarbamoyladenosine biosynthesis protein TsaB
MSSPRLLALDTATETLHLAVVQGDRVLTRALPGGALSSASLLPAVADLLAQAGWALAQLDAIAFGRGPGAFTGLRGACSVSQGLALGLDRPLIAIDTLAAVAEAGFQQGAGEQVWALLDARMDEIYAARWSRLAPGHWAASEGLTEAVDPAPHLYAPAALLQAIEAAPADLAGPGLDAHAAALASAAGRRFAAALPDGAALAVLARSAHARGEWIDPSQALPLYVRDKVAQTTAERAVVRQAATLPVR